MWFYAQRSGKLCINETYIGIGYSGKGAAKNVPLLEQVPNSGPIPSGRYQIGAAYSHPTKGPLVMRLTPVDHNALGRSGFLIHGDSSKHPGEASEGCIVLDFAYRIVVARSSDKQLTVTP